jgi:hypothetical protein
MQIVFGAGIKANFCTKDSELGVDARAYFASV